jgi:MarR family transcriptional regulator, organic hydroperoxide resistance regulator
MARKSTSKRSKFKTVKRKRAARPHGARETQRQQAMQVLRSFRIIFGSVREHFRSVEKACGVSGSQLWILKEVARTPDIGVSELATRLAIHQSTGSQLVEKLVRSGHLVKRRSHDDQRRVGLQVTARGRRTLECAPGPSEGLLPEALSELAAPKLAGLQQSLQWVIAKLDLEVTDAADEPLANL